MPQTVTIDFEGIMILSFKDNKCVIGIPPTDNRHDFLLVQGTGAAQTRRVIGKESQLYVVDRTGNRLPDSVITQPATSFFTTAIGFKSFHSSLQFKAGYRHRNRLEIFNGTFSVQDSEKTRGAFRRGPTGSEVERDVAKSIRLVIELPTCSQAVFEDAGGKLYLESSQTYHVLNICEGSESRCGTASDFRYYYNAFNIELSEQMNARSVLLSPNLPCWPGGYEGEPPQPPAE